MLHRNRNLWFLCAGIISANVSTSIIKKINIPTIKEYIFYELPAKQYGFTTNSR
jgi:hypothetical protein